MKLEHLLTDIHFTLRTDHKNLIFLNTDFREKVQRWKLAIQHYNFDLEYIKGSDNIEADGFSRLLERDENEINMVYFLSNPKNRQDRLSEEVFRKIQKVHNAMVGHTGEEKTLRRLVAQGNTWRSMRRHVNQFISHCACCQKMSTLKLEIQTNPFTLAAYGPFQRIYVDTVGPINVGTVKKNFKYILVIIDAFSRYVRLYPTMSTTGKEATDAFLDWISLFGTPAEVVSDNGTQFVNDLISQFSLLSQIEHLTIQAYSKEENGMVERANKEVMRHLRAMVFNSKQKILWVDYVPLVQRILYASIHSVLGVSPAQIVFGTSVRLDKDFLWKQKDIQDTSDKTYHEYISQMLLAQRELLKIAQDNQIEADEFQIAKRSRKVITEFPINSYVLVNYENEDKKAPSKLHTYLRGPLRVVSIQGSVYTLQNLVTNKLEDFHVSLLHPFVYDATRDNPRLIAQHDEDFFDIERIIEHRFTGEKSDAKKKSNLELKILWTGYAVADWQSWSKDLAKNRIVHEYLERHKLKRFIPKGY
jgi:transposase InsO family protein